MQIEVTYIIKHNSHKVLQRLQGHSFSFLFLCQIWKLQGIPRFSVEQELAPNF